MSAIPRAPIRAPAMTPDDPRYYDARDLEVELRRTFQICHECRMCVNYCGSFPSLFARIDRDVDSGRAVGAEALGADDFRAVGDECWQCKLCYIKCPYTVDEGAYELLDYPRLMAREKANHVRRNGVDFTDRLLGEPQVIGAAGAGIAAPISNLVQANRLVRKVQEKVTGISADFRLPPFARRTFRQWFDDHEPLSSAGRAGEVTLFPTCYGEYNLPRPAQAAVLTLEHNGYRVFQPIASDASPGWTCCGMPNLDGGDIEAFVAKAKQNVAALLPHVRAGRKIVSVGPTCGYTMKKEWADHLGTAEAKEVAAATVDLMEFFVLLGRQKTLARSFERPLGNVAYHAACHLRAQKIGFPGARVLGAVPDTDVRVIEQCSAVDGGWGMKAAHYETGRKYARNLVGEVRDGEADFVVSDCALAGLRIEQENERDVLHPVEALAIAYGLSPDPRARK